MLEGLTLKSEQGWQKPSPQARQWCKVSVMPNLCRSTLTSVNWATMMMMAALNALERQMIGCVSLLLPLVTRMAAGYFCIWPPVGRCHLCQQSLSLNDWGWTSLWLASTQKEIRMINYQAESPSLVYPTLLNCPIMSARHIWPLPNLSWQYLVCCPSGKVGSGGTWHLETKRNTHTDTNTDTNTCTNTW